MQKHKKALVFLVCFIYVFTFFFSVLFIAAEASHHCSGANCPICAEMRVCANHMKPSADISADSLAFVALGLISAAVFIVGGAKQPLLTLVSLKVKFSN